MSQVKKEPLRDTVLLGVDKPSVGNEGGTHGLKTIGPNLVGLPAFYGNLPHLAFIKLVMKSVL